jgi:sRNA-binding protein
MFLIPSAAYEVNLDGNHQAQLAERKAIRAAQLEERRAQREAFRPEKKSRVIATRARPVTSR